MSRRSETTSLSAKPAKTAVDPSVGQAQLQIANTAQQAQDFAQDFQTQYVAPAIAHLTDSDARTQDRLDAEYASAKDFQAQQLQLAQQQEARAAAADARAAKSQDKVDAVVDENLTQMKLQRDRYEKFGIPAEDAYYKMVDDYSAPEYEEQQAGLGLGDVRSAAGAQKQTLMRNLAAMGINPSSPAALAVMSDSALSQAATEAAASNKARMAAQQLGMSLKSDAANFGRGGLSGILQFGQQATSGASANAGQQAGQAASATAAGQGYYGLALNGGAAAQSAATSGYGVANSTLTGINGSAGIPLAGYGTAMKGYSANLDAGVQLTKVRQDAANASSAGWGQLLGTAAGVGAKVAMSDRRLKTNIVEHGHFPSGLPLYEFDYVTDAGIDLPTGRQMGVMADEAKVWFPEAVDIDEASGFYRVDYSKLR